MNYLVLDGCTHIGNTWRATGAVMNQMKENDPDCTFDVVHLINLKLDYCIGCSNCFRKGPDFCPHKSIMSVLLEKMDQCDALLIVSTTYNTRETALLKNFLDHLNYLLHRPRFFTKKALVITTVGGFGGKTTVKSIAGTLRGMGFNKCYGLALAAISWNAYVISDKHRKLINKVTDQFQKDVEAHKMHYPDSLVLIPYNLFRAMAKTYAPGTEYETQDGVYYLHKKRAYDEAIPLLPHQVLFGQMFYLIGKIAGKRMMVTYKK